MKKWCILIAMAAAVSGFTTLMPHKNMPEDINDAINKRLPLLQSSSYTFLVNAEGCHSCHGQGIGGVAFALAREKGFTIQDSILKQAHDSIQANWTQRMHYLAQNTDPAAVLISGGYDKWAFDANGITPNKTSEMLAKNILLRQRKCGGWLVPNPRPPIEYYDVSGTAIAIRGFLRYLPRYCKKIFNLDCKKRRNG